MPYVTGPVATLLVAGAALAALVIWVLRRPRHPGPRLVGHDGIDREVRELEAGRHPDDGFEGDDWGPGAARPRPPVKL